MFGLGLENLNAVGQIARSLEKIINDSGFREKFAVTGKISGRISLEDYELTFTLRRLNRDD